MPIAFEGVSYSYEGAGGRLVLDDVNLTVADGEFLGIAGHTGSGKSTLIQHMNGILHPTAGRVTAYGVDLADKKAKSRGSRAYRRGVPIPRASAVRRHRHRRRRLRTAQPRHRRRGDRRARRAVSLLRGTRSRAGFEGEPLRAFGRPAAPRRHRGRAGDGAGRHRDGRTCGGTRSARTRGSSRPRLVAARRRAHGRDGVPLDERSGETIRSHRRDVRGVRLHAGIARRGVRPRRRPARHRPRRLPPAQNSPRVCAIAAPFCPVLYSADTLAQDIARSYRAAMRAEGWPTVADLESAVFGRFHPERASCTRWTPGPSCSPSSGW